MIYPVYQLVYCIHQIYGTYTMNLLHYYRWCHSPPKEFIQLPYMYTNLYKLREQTFWQNKFQIHYIMLLSGRVWKQLHDLLSKNNPDKLSNQKEGESFLQAIFKQCIKLEFGSLRPNLSPYIMSVYIIGNRVNKSMTGHFRFSHGPHFGC